jgi:hypothetical protein
MRLNFWKNFIKVFLVCLAGLLFFIVVPSLVSYFFGEVGLMATGVVVILLVLLVIAATIADVIS